MTCFDCKIISIFVRMKLGQMFCHVVLNLFVSTMFRQYESSVSGLLIVNLFSISDQISLNNNIRVKIFISPFFLAHFYTSTKSNAKTADATLLSL